MRTPSSQKCRLDLAPPLADPFIQGFPIDYGDASIASQPGEIDRVVLLGAYPNGPAEKLKCASLFITARDDANEDGPRLPRIREQYEKAPQPKALIILDGSAHAQFLFQTDQADRVMREILHFLSAK
jgi:hypothetical protein